MEEYKQPMMLIIRNRLLVDLSDEERLLYSINFGEAKAYSESLQMDDAEFKRRRKNFRQHQKDRFDAWKDAAFKNIYPDSNEIASVMASLSNDVFQQSSDAIRAQCSKEVSVKF